MVKIIIFFIFLGITFNCTIRKNNCQNEIAKKLFENKIKLLEDSSTFKLDSLVYEFEEFTNIKSTSDGNYFGRFKVEERDLKEWKNWYELNKNKLCYDIKEDKIYLKYSKINSANFSSNPRVNLWGCNLGGSNKSEMGASPAQAMANQVGGSVKAFVGGGGAEYKVNGSGRNIYNGTMIRSADRASQQTRLTTFQRKP
jgi:hypothetical protein